MVVIVAIIAMISQRMCDDARDGFIFFFRIFVSAVLRKNIAHTVLLTRFFTYVHISITFRYIDLRFPEKSLSFSDSGDDPAISLGV